MATTKNTQPTQQTPTLFTRLMSYGNEYVGWVIVTIILSTLGSIATIVGPDRISEITNLIVRGIATSIDLDEITRLTVIMALIYAGGALLTYLQTFIITGVIQSFIKKLRTAVSKKINVVPLSYFDSHTQGDTLSRVTNDMDMLSQSLNQSLASFVPSMTLLIGVIYMMFRNNAWLSWTTIGAVFFGFVLMIVIMMNARKHYAAQQTKLAAVNGYIEEHYSGHNVLKATNATEESVHEFEVLNSDLYSSVWRAQFLQGIMQPLMAFIGNFGYVAVCIVGAVLALDGTISFGVIVAFMVYVRLFTQPLGQLAQAFGSLQQAGAAMNRVFEFLEAEEMEDESAKTTPLPEVKGHVEFDHISFGYTPEKTIIHDFTAEALPGQKVAIVGPTGAGKTTMVNLLMKFYEVNSGTIKIDGVKTTDLTRQQIHDQFCMVLQDTWLFEGTIKENLVYNQTGITDDQVIQAAKAVGIHHFIKTLPKGYDTVLNDSVSLSVGQKQLLTIARAMIKNAPMLILDEATSSVDTRTEELIQQAMDRLMKGRTSFVIAHRLSTIRNADLILVMKDGNIIEKGNHDELMSQNGFYADLYNSQFTEEEE